MILKYNYSQFDSAGKIIALSLLVLLVNLAVMASGIVLGAALAHIGWNLV